MQEIYRRGLVLDSGTLALAALALDTKEGSQARRRQECAQDGLRAQSLTPELEANLSSAVSAALSLPRTSPPAAQAVHGGCWWIWGLHQEAVEAGKPGCEVLCRTWGLR